MEYYTALYRPVHVGHFESKVNEGVETCTTYDVRSSCFLSSSRHTDRSDAMLTLPGKIWKKKLTISSSQNKTKLLADCQQTQFTVVLLILMCLTLWYIKLKVNDMSLQKQEKLIILNFELNVALKIWLVWKLECHAVTRATVNNYQFALDLINNC